MKRAITIYWDIELQRHRNSAGELLRKSDYPYIVYKEQPIVNLKIVIDEDLTPYTGLGDSGESYTAAIDQDFDPATDPMCKTLDANINIAGDFSVDSSGDATASAGEFSIRMNANTAEYLAAVGTTQRITTTTLEFLAYNGGDVIFSIQMPIICKNILDDAGSVPPGLDETAIAAGTVDILNNASHVEVTGLSLGSAPDQILVTVGSPSGSSDLIMFASVRVDTISVDGFIVDLNGTTDSTGYKLYYLIILS